MLEKIIETKVCKKCNSNFEITDKDLEFYDKVSPKFNGEKYIIPTPTLCPDCRQQRRLSFRNERKLYKRKCDATGENIIWMYSPDKPYKVYNQDFWLSDKWDAIDYWISFNFNKSFFEQLKNLDNNVPKMSLSNLLIDNSEYVNMAWRLKNCYLVYNADSSEDCYYWKGVYQWKNCIDFLWTKESENCYECIDCLNCNNVMYWQTSNNSKYCKYIFDCENCSNCVACVSLKNSSYCIYNVQYSKEEYEGRIKNISIKDIYDNFIILRKKIPIKSNNNINIDNVLWDYVSSSKNINNCFDIHNSSDLKYSTDLFDSNDVQDISYYGMGLSLSYEGATIWEWYNILFSNDCWWNINNIMYSYFCVNNCSNLFWCVWLKNAEYCILNKQYSKEEYNILVPKIIEYMKTTWEWWEFFPSSISPFWYNETVANEYFPLNKEEILEQWFNYSDYESPLPKVDKIIPAEKLPENIADIPDDILNWAIKCEVSWKPFRIISQELEFYRKHNLPIPRKHPDVRHFERMKLRNPRKLFDKKCDKCGVDMKTTYSPNREETVYCEECYEKEIY